MTTRARCKHRVQLIQHMQMFSDGRLGVIPSKRIGSVQSRGSRRSRHVRSGSSCTHAVVEVVVRVDGSGT